MEIFQRTKSPSMLSWKSIVLFKVIVICNVALASASLSFVIEPSNKIVAEGKSVILNCEAADSQGRSFGINWKRNNIWLLDPSNQPWQLLQNNSLYYPSITAQDVGQFRCAAAISGTSDTIYSRIARVQLAYTDAQFSSSPRNNTKRVGDPSTYFTCITGDSLPSASVYWEKDGQTFTIGIVTNKLIDSGKQGIKWTSSSLLINNIDLSSAGFYCCVAMNPLVPTILRKSNSGYLNVLPRIDKPHFQVHPSNLIAAEGKPATLQCWILGVPKPLVSWTFNGQLLTSSPTRQILSNGSLYFTAVNKTYAGQYKCKGSNSVGVVESSGVLFSVAFFNFQFFEHPASQNVTMGTQTTLHCRPPSSYPIKIQINWFKNYQPVQAGPGVSVTSSGSLVFSAIKKSDKGEYFCNGINPVLMQSRTSNVARITVWVPPTFRIRPQPTAVIQYEPLLLHCESTGFPTPSLTWLKDARTPNTSHVNILANSSLSITRSTVKDAGEYMCVASNVGGNASVKAEVVIYVPPSVTNHPTDAIRVLGQPVTFKCNFTGIPLPRVQWFHDNGTKTRPVPFTSKYIRAGYTLSVTSVSVQDEGTFVCKGINVAGAVNVSAHLNVQVPVSLDAGPVNITVNQSSAASFQCIASGDPKPNVTWYKGETQLQNNGHFIITGDTLSIPSTQPNDAGQYRCHVTNGLATHVGKGYLVVQVSPVIISFNVPAYVRQRGNLSTTCQPSGIPHPQVKWYKDGNVILPGSRVFLSDDGALTIMGVVDSDGGVYTCVAGNDAGWTSRKGNVTVQVPPSSPSSLSATPESSTSIKLSWQPGFNGHSPITGYRVDMKREYQPSFSEVESSIFQLELVVSGLMPYTRYTFRVSARNVVGWGQPTEVFNRTLEDAPSEPNNVLLTTLNATAIQAHWSAPSSPNGVVTWYEIMYQSLPNGLVLKETLLAFGSSMSFVLSGLRSFTDYAVRVRAGTGHLAKKWGNFTKAVVNRTAQAAPDDSPRDVKCSSFNHTAVFVSWKPVPIGSANGDVKEYRISYQATGPYHYSDVTIVTVDGGSQNITIKDLHPWTDYNISVQAFTVGVGPGSHWKTVRTLEAAPSGSPTITVTYVNESSIALNMTAPIPHMRNGYITGFVIYHKKSNSTSAFSEFSSSSTMALIRNLVVFTKYDVKAAATTRAGVGIPSDTITVKTGEGVPNAIEDITVVKVSHDVIEMTWQPPQPETGLVIDYTVYFNSTNGVPLFKTVTHPSITLTNLSHNTTYHIWVIARTKKGTGPIGKIITVETRHPPLQTTGSPGNFTTPPANKSGPSIIVTIKETNGFLSLNQRDSIIVVASTGGVLLILIIVIICLICVRSKSNRGFSDSAKTRKLGRSLDVHELRGISPDRRPVLEVQEETSINGSFDEFSDWNSSFTGVASDQVTDPAPVKITPILELPEGSGIKPVEGPVNSSPPPPPLQPIQQDVLSSPVIPSYPLFKNSPVARIRNKKPSLGSNDSFYDQPYSSVDELGTGFASFTPPPPPDFRNDEVIGKNNTPMAHTPQEFSNQLYDNLHDQPQPKRKSSSASEFSEPGYAKPEFKTSAKSKPEDYAEPEVFSPPLPYFSSDYNAMENEGYDTDEELDQYLGKQEVKSKKNNERGTPTRSPTSSRSHSVSPPSQASADANKPEVEYAKPDLTKKKKNRQCRAGDSKTPYDAVVVYDERTNL